jgi:hypothetical protein
MCKRLYRILISSGSVVLFSFFPIQIKQPVPWYFGVKQQINRLIYEYQYQILGFRVLIFLALVINGSLFAWANLVGCLLIFCLEMLRNTIFLFYEPFHFHSAISQLTLFPSDFRVDPYI